MGKSLFRLILRRSRRCLLLRRVVVHRRRRLNVDWTALGSGAVTLSRRTRRHLHYISIDLSVDEFWRLLLLKKSKW